MHSIVVEDRPPLNQVQYEMEYGSVTTDGKNEMEKFKRKVKSTYCDAFTGIGVFMRTVSSFLPIIHWLPAYSWKSDLVADIVGGLTTGIMHVPQGIAYSVLAGVDPVYGLYSSCFPAFFYMFFGTSRHASIGSFAVVALMAGVAMDNVYRNIEENPVISSLNGTETVINHEVSPIQVATMLTLTLGIWQLLCGVFRLHFIMTYFSDPLVSGFTTGAAVHVLLAQLDDLIGVSVPKASGPGYIFVRLYDLAVRIPQSNIVAIIISLCSMSFLYIGKEYLSPFLSKKGIFKFPIPYELILVAFTAFLSALLSWNDINDVLIVGPIPAGLPKPQLPNFSVFQDCFTQSAGIAVVTIAVHVSMSKMLAKKFDYKIDTNQELYAIGISNVLGSFFPIYPVSTALGRTMVSVKSGTKTQLSTIFSCALLLAIILWLGPLLQDLPKCVLASIITIALLSMFRKFSILKELWPVSKSDFMIWVVAFVATVTIDVMEGLVIALIFTLITVVFRSQWPRSQYLVPDLSRENEECPCNIGILQFSSPILFTNVERFQSCVGRALNEWDIKMQKNDRAQRKPASTTKFFILDFSSVPYIDYMGINTLKEVCRELRNRGFSVYIAAVSVDVEKVMMESGFHDLLSKEHLFPTLQDAIAIAKRNTSALQMLAIAKKEQVSNLDSNKTFLLSTQKNINHNSY